MYNEKVPKCPYFKYSCALEDCIYYYQDEDLEFAALFDACEKRQYSEYFEECREIFGDA